MSGHSKWATTKHKKGKIDAARGKIFTKIAREIIVAAKTGGGDPEANSRLRLALEKAKAANMPNDNITRAVRRGTGEIEGAVYEEMTYEGYGPGGTAIMLDITSDNRNRTAGEIRHIFSRNNGNLGEIGCVSWMFSRKGMIILNGESIDEDELMLTALDAGADDVTVDNGSAEIITEPDSLEDVRNVLTENYTIESAEITMLPQNTIALEGDTAEKMLKLLDLLEEHDDVQAVYTNADFPDELLD